MRGNIEAFHNIFARPALAHMDLMKPQVFLSFRLQFDTFLIARFEVLG